MIRSPMAMERILTTPLPLRVCFQSRSFRAAESILNSVHIKYVICSVLFCLAQITPWHSKSPGGEYAMHTAAISHANRGIVPSGFIYSFTRFG